MSVYRTIGSLVSIFWKEPIEILGADDSCIYLQFSDLKKRSITRSDTTKTCNIRGSTEHKSNVTAISLWLSKAESHKRK